MVFELEQFASTRDWHVYSFGNGGQNQLVYICQQFGWSISDFIINMTEKYKAEIKYMKTDGKVWIYYRWLDTNVSGALRFHSDLSKKIRRA